MIHRRNQNTQGWGALVFQKIKKHVYFNLQNGRSTWQNVARSNESILLSKEAADDNGGMFQEHFKENLRWKYRNFSSDTCEGIVQVCLYKISVA